MLNKQYVLRQIVPPLTKEEPNPVRPIVIHINEDEVHVGRRKIISLNKFPQISRDHAVLYKAENGNLFIKDLNSLNGIFVNDQKIGKSLKILKDGDIIGFGVSSAAVREGFVCILRFETKVKPEVIEISDEEEPDIVVNSVKNSIDSNLQNSVLEESSIASCSHYKNQNTCHNDNSDSSESLDSKNNHESQNHIKNSQYQNNSRLEKSSENMPLKKLFVRLERCDSRNFVLPPDVRKTPFHKNINCKKRRRANKWKRIRITSESSSDSEDNIHLPNTTSSENKIAKLALDDKDHGGNRDNLTSCIKLDDNRKRKLPDIFVHESLNDVSSSYKAADPLHSNLSNNLVSKGKDDHEMQDKANCEMSYSQVEEIIYISDSESYLDISASQENVHIKQEPEEIEDLITKDELYKEIFERESVYSSSNDKDESDSQDLDKVESIESIRAFVNKSEQKDLKGLSSELNHRFNSKYLNILSEESNIGPSEDSNSDSIDSTDEGNALCTSELYRKKSVIENSFKENQITSINPFTTKNIKKSSGTILLTDPKPMAYRPRRLRGRDEGFVEKIKSSTQQIEDTKKFTKVRSKTIGEKETSSSDKRKSQIPCSSPSIHVKQGKRNEACNLTKQTSTSIKDNGHIKKKSSVKTRPEALSSRMSFLINEKEISVQQKTKVTKPNTSESVHINRKNMFQLSAARTNVSEGITHFKNNNAQTVSKQSAPSINKVVCSSKASTALAIATDHRKSSKESQKPYEFSSKNVKETELKKILPTPGDKKSGISADVSGRSTSLSKNDSLFYKLSFNGMIKSLLQMNTKWLLEQNRVVIPPPVVSKGAADLPLSYHSYKSYASSLYPMIMLEIWEYMYLESKQVYNSNKQYKKFYFSVLSYTSKEDCIELKCESVLHEKMGFGPREGVIAILELMEDVQKCSPKFGYIFRHKTEPLNLISMKNSLWKNFPQEWLKRAKLWTFHAYIKKKDMSFALNTLMKGNGLCYIRSKLRLADALLYFKNSPLLIDILQPREATFSLNHIVSSPSREYTSSQMEFINHVNNELNKPHMLPKIVLLQGPPGTGKSHAIVGLLEKLFYHCKNKSTFKILITAPSNEAIDVIGCRIIELNKKYVFRGNNIKFVRVGLEKQVHAKMLPHFIDNKVKELFQLSSQSTNWKENKLQNLLSEINKLEMEPYSKNRNERIRYLRDQCKLLRDQNSVQSLDYYTDMMYKSNILKESHIILSTLNCCSLSLFQKNFLTNSNMFFSCCIIDEATQCTELEILQPLIFGIRKLVLVGDHEQLPPSVLSKLAAQYGFQRSMFERFHLFFKQHNKEPLFTLREQFRMHPEICKFPSKYFYAHRVFTHPDLILRFKAFPLKPYTVLDISTCCYSVEELHKIEIAMLLNICEFLITSGDFQFSIGIIVSHETKRLSLLKTLHNHACYKHIEINTVDGFQGRERDVIVVFVLSASTHPDGVSFLSSKQQLNVSLTRAKKCLIICADSANLMVYPDWRALIHDAQERNLCLPVESSKHVPLLLENCVKKKRL